MMTLPQPDAVLRYWFGETPGDDAADAQSKLWWGKDAATDQQIRERFTAARDAAVAGTLSAWENDAHSRLALILLIDQFSRNMYRNDPRAFADDALARQWCKGGLALGHDRALLPIERVFFYLPLEHSESLEDQQRCVALFEALENEVADERRKSYAFYLDFARRHLAIIERFGRFPHRNAILGRESTPEEAEFLQQPGSSF
jgi:uncharacterized protein (DUF924 family)